MDEWLSSPYSHAIGVLRHLKTTLNIGVTIMAKLRRELAPLHAIDSGGHLVESANREALYTEMEREQSSLPTPTSWSTPPIRTPTRSMTA
jgi:hypothetical protein